MIECGIVEETVSHLFYNCSLLRQVLRDISAYTGNVIWRKTGVIVPDAVGGDTRIGDIMELIQKLRKKSFAEGCYGPLVGFFMAHMAGEEWKREAAEGQAKGEN